MEKLNLFLKRLGMELYKLLPKDWEFEEKGDFRCLKKFSWGYGGVHVSIDYKNLPICSLYLSYGITHDILKAPFKKLDQAGGFFSLDTYQFSQSTLNQRIGNSSEYIFVEDYNVCEPQKVVTELFNNSTDSLLEYFERFSDLRRVRDSLEAKDKSFLSFGVVDAVIVIDLVLDDLAHLNEYRKDLDRMDTRMLNSSLKTLNITL